MNRTLLLAISLTAVAGAAAAGPIEDQIRFRQSAYSFISWNTGKIKKQVVDEPASYDKEQVIAAANAIAAVANSGLGALYGPGTDQGTGWRPTQLKAEFFQKPDDAKRLALAFNAAANELARAAAGGDPAAIKTQFGKLSETCKSCHNSFRQRD
ncbi:MAG TPA: cytochrome c [Steroidobacter sp.]|nr:cytochrome c [Steroidobacter sp.]